MTMENLQFATRVRNHLPEINPNGAAWVVGKIQMAISTAEMALLLVIGLVSYILNDLILFVYENRRKPSGWEVLLIKQHGDEVYFSWLTVGLLACAFGYLCWAAIRLIDSTREAISMACRRQLAEFWKKVTIGFLILDMAVCLQILGEIEIIYFYGIPVTALRILFLYLVNGHIKDLGLRQPFGAKRTAPSFSTHLKRCIKKTAGAVAGMIFSALLFYWLVKPSQDDLIKTLKDLAKNQAHNRTALANKI